MIYYQIAQSDVHGCAHGDVSGNYFNEKKCAMKIYKPQINLFKVTN